MVLLASSLSLRTVRDGLGLSRERMARLLDVSTRTVERWEARDELPSGRFALDQLAVLARVVELGRAVYDEPSFRRFVVTPLPAFGGRSALQLAEVGEAERVVGALASLHEGQGLQRPVALADHVGPWSGVVYRHIPDGSPFGVLDFRFAAVAADNRWNAAGEPTLYLAGDPAVAGAELWRHVDANFRPSVVGTPLSRRLYSLELRLSAVFDLCAPGAWAALDLPNAPDCFLDRTIARAVARYVRVALPVVALRVPSVAFLDDPSRHNLVVFLEKLPADPTTWIDRVSDEGTIRFES